MFAMFLSGAWKYFNLVNCRNLPIVDKDIKISNLFKEYIFLVQIHFSDFVNEGFSPMG